MNAQPIETAPKDEPILVCIDGLWIQANWQGYSGGGCWSVISCDSHGCGCCGGGNNEPTHWAPLPKVM